MLYIIVSNEYTLVKVQQRSNNCVYTKHFQLMVYRNILYVVSIIQRLVVFTPYYIVLRVLF